MKDNLPQPFKNAIIFEDNKLYTCLSNSPMVSGHVVVVWKKLVSDIDLLNRRDYNHLMIMVKVCERITR